MNTFTNGRVDIMSPDNLTSYKLFSETKVNKNNLRNNAVGSLMEASELSNTFFSNTNVNALQEAIRYSVYKATKGQHIIGRQSETDLQVIMRGIYLEYGKNLPYNINNQVIELNKKVLDFAVPKITAEIVQYMRYKKDVSTLPIPLQHPTNMSSAGSRQLFMKEL